MSHARVLLVCVTLLIASVATTTAQSNMMAVRNTGVECSDSVVVAMPYSVVWMNADGGNVLAVEHVDCKGIRTVFNDNVKVHGSYQAYSSKLHEDNVPRLSSGQHNNIVVYLDKAATIEVRDGATGTLIARFPRSGEERTEYMIPTLDLEPYAGHLVVVDVINTSDGSYRGTASIPYQIN